MLDDLTPEEIVALVRIIRITEHAPPALFAGPNGKMTTLDHLPGIQSLGEKINESGNREDVKRYLEENYGS